MSFNTASALPPARKSGPAGWFQGIGDKLSEMPLGQRIIASLLAVALVAGGIFAALQLAKPTLAPLFTVLSSTDAAAVVEQLNSAGVEYELQDGGTTILVPDEAVYDQRLSAAAAGLPSGGGTGYNLLDEVGITSSEFQQDTTYKRALEGELAATIGQMDGVDQASVKLAMPEETVFASEQGTPTASVFVSSPRGDLNNQQVQAIVHLASASVEGMEPTDVAVVDSTGKVLSAVGEGLVDLSGGDGERSAAVTANVQKVLDNLVGAGNSTVAATVATTRSTSETVSEEFATPEGGVQALTEQTASEDYTGGGAPAGTGVLGPDNVANTDANTAGSGEFTSESDSRTNAVDKTTTSTTTPAGDVERQTVAVAVDAAAAGGLTTEQITGLVSTAAGLDEARGDTVTVEVIPFSTAGAAEAQQAIEAAEAAEAAAAQDALIRDVILYGIVAAVLLVGFVVWMILRRRRTVETLEDLGETAPAPAMLDRSTGPDTGQMPVIVPEPPTQALSALPPLPVVPAPLPEGPSAAQKVHHAAQTDPAKTAEMMRAMMEAKELA
ncbi:flagellar basal-body MS-ring/collar protein FliF [Citricoccus sp.]|uniref:flagellar basal-body MS-ring/collar protein FliF n=1 Tax=Citricoccus sp. TaxID=1978372 RepID=UPI0028BE9E9E|nr:flagellar basal-body MS-ring/collar protein FliF [Citricoccus sp.]